MSISAAAAHGGVTLTPEAPLAGRVGLGEPTPIILKIDIAVQMSLHISGWH